MPITSPSRPTRSALRPRSHVLVLGGTTEGRRVAQALTGAAPGPALPHVRVTSSLAGRVRQPLFPPGEVRVGGFGGVDGLAAWLRGHAVDAVVDATHPYAATMTAHAAQACAAVGVPLLRLDRPAWTPEPGDDWHLADCVGAAVTQVDGLGQRAFLTIGRLEVSAFAQVRSWCLVRSIERPDPPLPARHEVVLDRGPFDLAGERATFARWGIDVLVTKNSGGAATAPKLVVARELGIPVVVVARPVSPAGLASVLSVAEALAWLAIVV